MHASPFAFRSQAVQVDFQPDAAVLVAVRNSLREQRGDELNLNHVASTDERVLLQSPTGSTQVEINRQRLVLQTTLFGEFIRPDQWKQRAEYMRSKTNFVLSRLESAGAKLVYLGVSTDARASAASFGDRQALHAAAVAAAGIQNGLAEGYPCFDFTVRASRAVGDTLFSNIMLQWYQDRALPLNLLDAAQIAAVRVPLWDLAISDEGLQFQYDRNNKLALFSGRRDWSADEFVQAAVDCIEDAPGALSAFESVLVAAVSGAQEGR